MKPIDETWEARGNFIIRNCDESPERRHEIARFEVSFRNEDDEGRAKLAAEAPVMARMLRKLEWSAIVWRTVVCDSCWKTRDGGVHGDDCKWLAIMRRIGERAQ